MTVRTLFATPELQEGWKAMRAPVPALLLGLAVLGLVFHEEIAAAVFVWYDSTAYSHCYFVIPIAGYLAWDRRHSLGPVPIEPTPWAALLALPLGAAWLVAERLGIMEGRQLVAMTLVQVLFLTVLGWRMYWALCAPLLYLFFLVPFGAFVTPRLQDFTADFINHGLDFLQIPYASDGYTIEIPEGRFFVAEACAGLRFLIASIAFGALYSCLMYRSYWRRTLFMVASVIIPIIANGFRALGIVVLGHLLGSAQAAATDHILYGWLFFSIVILLLILAGLPFRQDMRVAEAELPASDMPPTPGVRRLLFASVLAAVFATAGPATSAWLDRSAPAGSAMPTPVFATLPGCRPMSAGAFATAPDVAMQRFACGSVQLAVTVQAFPPRANPVRMITAERLATGELGSGDEAMISSVEVPGAEPSRWRLVLTEGPARATAAALWIDGKPAVGGLAGRLAMARDSLAGSGYAPMLVTITVQLPRPQLYSGDQQFVQRVIRAFLAAQGNFSGQIAQLSMAAAR